MIEKSNINIVTPYSSGKTLRKNPIKLIYKFILFVAICNLKTFLENHILTYNIFQSCLLICNLKKVTEKSFEIYKIFLPGFDYLY